jgi:PHD/YefM family antitoxin component YafN of YafNO toxin-antitoxin module
MITKQQVVSVTELRTNTKQSLQNLEKGAKYIFSNNSPIAVLIAVEEYEMLMAPDLIELPNEEVSNEMLSMAKDALNSPKADLLDL